MTNRQNKLLVIDKDGTLVKTCSGQTFVQSPSDQQLIPGVERRLMQFKDDGWDIAIASNQGGVEAGHKTIAQAVEEMRFCIQLLPPGLIAEAFFCPDLTGMRCFWMPGSTNGGAEEVFHHSRYDVIVAGDRLMFIYPIQGTYRKRADGQPGHGMISLARRHDPDTVLFVGDREEDRHAAHDAGVEFRSAADWLAGFELANN